MFCIGVFLNNENCEQRHLICSVVLYSHQHSILYSEGHNHVKAGINITHPPTMALRITETQSLAQEVLFPFPLVLTISTPSILKHHIYLYLQNLCQPSPSLYITMLPVYGILECATRRHIHL